MYKFGMSRARANCKIGDDVAEKAVDDGAFYGYTEIEGRLVDF